MKRSRACLDLVCLDDGKRAHRSPGDARPSRAVNDWAAIPPFPTTSPTSVISFGSSLKHMDRRITKERLPIPTGCRPKAESCPHISSMFSDLSLAPPDPAKLSRRPLHPCQSDNLEYVRKENLSNDANSLETVTRVKETRDKDNQDMHCAEPSQ